MDSMTKSKRAIVHEMAEQYGIATASIGSEPHRAVQLFKPTGSSAQPAGIPSRLLSTVSQSTSDDKIEELLRSAQGFSMKFIDIAPTVDIHHYLRQWESQYEVEWEDSSSVIVRFQEEHIPKEVTNHLGGGIRGLFRIDIQWKPKTSITSNDIPATTTAPWGSNLLVGASTSGTSNPQWKAALTNPTRSSQGHSQQHDKPMEDSKNGGKSNGDEDQAVPPGWTIIGRPKT